MRPESGKRSRRPPLQLITTDGEAELYVTKRLRKPRQRPLNLERVSTDPGGELKRLRRGLRASIEQAATETKIGARYLHALESGATPDAFPAGAYARAFLRAYANYLRVDPDPFLAAHPATQPEPPMTVLSRVLREPIGRGFRLPPWLLPACIAIAAFILLISTSDHSPTVRSGLYNAPPAAQTSAAPTSAAARPTVPAEPALAHEIAVELRAVGGRCWVQAMVDGEVVAARTLRSRGELDVTGAHTIDLVLGNGRAAELIINGRRYELAGASGSVVNVHMVLENGHVEIQQT